MTSQIDRFLRDRAPRVLALALLVGVTSPVQQGRAQEPPQQELGMPPLPPEDPEVGLVGEEPSDENGAPGASTKGAAESGGSAQGDSFYTRSSYPDSGERGGQQTQILARGVLRIEGGPPDFALRDSGYLGEGRGLRIGRADHGIAHNPYAGLGLGVSFGVIENLEIGVLQLPIILANGYEDGDFGNIEVHGRYGIYKAGPAEIGAQLVVQLPSNRAFGVGMGFPIRILATEDLIFDLGVETEIVTYIPENADASTIVNLDVPIAANYFVTREAFVGARFGLFVWDFDDVFVPLGVQGGYLFRGGMVHLMGWFQWAAIPLGEYRYDSSRTGSEAFNAGSFEVGLGANVFLGFPRGGAPSP